MTRPEAFGDPDGVARPSELRYLPDRPRFVRIGRWLVAAYFLGSVVAAVVQQSWRPLANTLGAVSLAVVVLVLRMGKDRACVADQTRISRGLRGLDLAWADIECVQRPGRFDEVVYVRMKNGAAKPTGFPVSYAQSLATVGNKPMCG